MFFSTGAPARCVALPISRTAVRRFFVSAVLGGFMLLVGSVVFGPSSAVAASSCILDATPGTLAAQVSAAGAGDTICLATGNYGTFQGTNKQVTIRAADGASPSMRYAF